MLFLRGTDTVYGHGTATRYRIAQRLCQRVPLRTRYAAGTYRRRSRRSPQALPGWRNRTHSLTRTWSCPPTDVRSSERRRPRSARIAIAARWARRRFLRSRYRRLRPSCWSDTSSGGEGPRMQNSGILQGFWKVSRYPVALRRVPSRCCPASAVPSLPRRPCPPFSQLDTSATHTHTMDCTHLGAINGVEPVPLPPAQRTLLCGAHRQRRWTERARAGSACRCVCAWAQGRASCAWTEMQLISQL